LNEPALRSRQPHINEAIETAAIKPIAAAKAKPVLESPGSPVRAGAQHPDFRPGKASPICRLADIKPPSPDVSFPPTGNGRQSLPGFHRDSGTGFALEGETDMARKMPRLKETRRAKRIRTRRARRD
jgi:hypothetical protein